MTLIVDVKGTNGPTRRVQSSLPPLPHTRHNVTVTYLGDSTDKGSTADIIQIAD